MWLLLLVIVALWALAFLLWLLLKWMPPGGKVHHPPAGPGRKA
jgi:hypothetical protein